MSDFNSSQEMFTSEKYDLSPFLQAQAILERNSDGQIQPIAVPKTFLPSPTSSDLSPRRVKEVKTYLLRGAHSSSRVPGGNGKEIWESWKRAWDIWNNHYIEGRVNPEWVKNEWARRAALIKEHEGKSNRNGSRRYRGGGDDWPDFEIEGQDGRTAGFDAMKDFDDYKLSYEGETTGDAIDKLDNTLWRPKGTGEKRLVIPIDHRIEDWWNITAIDVKGGVDAGRSPYPVLRSLVADFETADGAFIRKKIWDGVTGSVFNTPTRSVEPDEVAQDQDHTVIQHDFDDFMGEYVWDDGNVFPIDIRRCQSTSPSTFLAKSAPLLEDGETRLDDRGPAKVEILEQRLMDKCDPWWMTEEQRELRDYPRRRYPPPERKYEPEYLLPDDTIWMEEFYRDQNLDSAYFMTNLHGGDLFINGQQVMKGEVAGPLPRFAVIQTPGDQISFWFGICGRKYPGRDEQISLRENLSWNTLRRQEGWKDVARTAGEVWDEKFKDRYEREKSGNSLDDDEQWECWKKGKVYPLRMKEISCENSKVSPSSTDDTSLAGQILIREPFDNEDDELRHLLESTKVFRPPGKLPRGILNLGARFLWSGSTKPADANSPKVTDAKLDALKQRHNQLNGFKQPTKQEQDQQIGHTRQALSAKRKADCSERPELPKRPIISVRHSPITPRDDIQRRPSEEDANAYSRDALEKEKQRLQGRAAESGRKRDNTKPIDAALEAKEFRHMISREKLRQTINLMRKFHGEHEIPTLLPQSIQDEADKGRAIDRALRAARCAREAERGAVTSGAPTPATPSSAGARKRSLDTVDEQYCRKLMLKSDAELAQERADEAAESRS
ncbi:hypothetical protein BJ878DRAFT_477465 [Calycina marina]|uniref:Uncharacterized protein n=1 Tax=Calycina marina TaxID=1763456 RepID=A0A9P7Z8S9_9HELO|nr:hypothetical protein BJ878DRAFT_477465 [Calycina marina]